MNKRLIVKLVVIIAVTIAADLFLYGAYVNEKKKIKLLLFAEANLLAKNQPQQDRINRVFAAYFRKSSFVSLNNSLAGWGWRPSDKDICNEFVNEMDSIFSEIVVDITTIFSDQELFDMCMKNLHN